MIYVIIISYVLIEIFFHKLLRRSFPLESCGSGPDEYIPDKNHKVMDLIQTIIVWPILIVVYVTYLIVKFILY